MYREVPHDLEDGRITLKELTPIIIVCALWGPHWLQLSVLVHCDNEGAVAIINSKYNRVEKSCICYAAYFLSKPDSAWRSKQYMYLGDIKCWRMQYPEIIWMPFITDTRSSSLSRSHSQNY